MKPKKRFGRPIKIIGSEALQAELLSEDVLKRWSHLSIKNRCLKIKRLYGVDVPVTSLCRFYKRNGLGFRVAKSELYPHNRNLEELQQERYAYAMKLSDFILDNGTEVIYFDESSFHS